MKSDVQSLGMKASPSSGVVNCGCGTTENNPEKAPSRPQDETSIIKAYQDLAKQMQENSRANTGLGGGVCPSCGACPTCGRRNLQYNFPSVPYYPQDTAKPYTPFPVIYSSQHQY